jgi:hypothetical protein
VIFAFDCDGTATKYPEIFVAMGRALKAEGHRVVILTGIDMATFNSRRKAKYPHLADSSWYDQVITADSYNDDERKLAVEVIAGRLDNHVLVGIYKRRVCAELGVGVLFDDDVTHVRARGAVPVFGVA